MRRCNGWQVEVLAKFIATQLQGALPLQTDPAPRSPQGLPSPITSTRDGDPDLEVPQQPSPVEHSTEKQAILVL